MRELVIIGAGPAGLTAAIYARRAGVNVLVCESRMYGGQLVDTDKIENYPSYKSVEGWQLAREMYLHAEQYGTEFLYETVTGIEKTDKGFRVKTDSKEIDCLAVIIANGSKRKKIGCKGSEKFEGKGISYCAVCDGRLYKDKPVCVVGGGNTAYEDALYLSGLCSHVYICAKTFSAEKALTEQAENTENITVISGYPTEIYGDPGLSGIRIGAEDIEVSAVFAILGQTRDNAVFGSVVTLDEKGYIAADESCLAAEGIWVAGDTRTKSLRQIVTAASDGAVAATGAAAYIKKNKK